jgi:hypothetical protein
MARLTRSAVSSSIAHCGFSHERHAKPLPLVLETTLCGRPGHAALAFDAGLLEGKSGMVVRDSNAEPNEGQKGIWKPVEPA